MGLRGKEPNKKLCSIKQVRRETGPIRGGALQVMGTPSQQLSGQSGQAVYASHLSVIGQVPWVVGKTESSNI